ncbi:dephospho-CoA kinase [Helicobacter sp. 23-1045]
MTHEFKNAIALTGGIATGKSTACSILKLHGYPIIDTDLIAHEVLEQSKDKVVQIFGDEILLDSAKNAESPHFVIASERSERGNLIDSATNTSNCHSEHSEESQKNRDSSIASQSQNDKINADSADFVRDSTDFVRDSAIDSAKIARDSAKIKRKPPQINRKKLGAIVFSDKAKLRALESILHPKIRAVAEQKAQIFEAQNITYFIDIPLFYELQERGSGYAIPLTLLIYAPRDLQLARIQKRDNLSAESANLRLKNQIDIELKKQKADFIIENTGNIRDLQDKIEIFLQQI